MMHGTTLTSKNEPVQKVHISLVENGWRTCHTYDNTVSIRGQYCWQWQQPLLFESLHLSVTFGKTMGSTMDSVSACILQLSFHTPHMSPKVSWEHLSPQRWYVL